MIFIIPCSGKLLQGILRGGVIWRKEDIMGRLNGRTKIKLSAMAKREEKWALLFVAAPAVGFLLFLCIPYEPDYLEWGKGL